MAGFDELNKIIEHEKKVVNELAKLYKDLAKVRVEEEKQMISSHIISLKNELKRTNNELEKTLSQISLTKPFPNLSKEKQLKPAEKPFKKSSLKEMNLSKFEKTTLKRLREKEEKDINKKIRKPSSYVKFANKWFSNFSDSFLEKGKFRSLKRNLIKANLRFLPKSYVSVMFFTTLLSFIISLFLFIFLIFFNVTLTIPFIIPVSGFFGLRFLKLFSIILIIPILTFVAMYFYPAAERKSVENRINYELPFAAIHMSSISGSMIDPTQIFRIMVTTKEYPYLEKEFVKLVNEINVLGYDLVTALRNSAFNSPSKKLSELYNGLATTINSGGDLPEFFEKRAQTLLFEYRIEREKKTRSAETFMDIYISVVIAAPMILMLLLMMMKVSGLGIALSTGMISLIMVLGVSVINIGFLVFLHLRGAGE